MELFSPKTSIFHKRWKCLNLTRKEVKDFAIFASVINKHRKFIHVKMLNKSVKFLLDSGLDL